MLRWSSAVGRGLALAAALSLGACGEGPWNDPYPSGQAKANVVYSAFAERPKHLDPARSYSENEYAFIAQVYEPPLQYHLLLRPYRLVPLAADAVPVPVYRDAAGNILPADASASDIQESEYLIRLKPGGRYQPHPAFARDAGGAYRYHHLSEADLTGIHTLADFPEIGTRDLTAEDYIYQIKRLAAPWSHSPIAGVMSEHIAGFADLSQRLKGMAPEAEDAEHRFVDLRQVPFSGAEAVDTLTYRIRIKGKYPQFAYWLAMPFFAPMPWEAEAFYNQPGMKARNLTLDWYPVGTGPYWLRENNQNLRMVLERNPHFRGETYPAEGMPGDAEAGLLADAGKPLPMVDRAIYSLEKESIPYWNKFLQGYYDSSGVSSDAFDQAVQLDPQGEARLTAAMEARGIRLLTSVRASVTYMGFNMQDPVVGGYLERARLLRRALAIAVDFDEYISIFANGRGVVAQSPLAPGIFGFRDGEAGIDPYVFQWRDGRVMRRPLEEAKALLAQAGWPGGRDQASGQTLTLYFDAAAGGADDKSRLNWMRKQFARLGIELVVRSTDYNRFQDKMRKGTAQIFMWGWNADYPDPENFLFLLYGPNGKVKADGENAANYANPEFDVLFEQMRNMDNGPERQAVIDRMVEIARRDAPWIWGFHAVSYTLHHAWLYNAVPNLMANNTLKYRRVDPIAREAARRAWNRPVLWPLWGIGLVLVLGALPAVWIYRRRERSRAL
jgi:oligopeptide transport system substrate-binding protein